MGIIDPTQKEIMDEQKAYLKDKGLKYKLAYFKDYYLKGVLIILVFVFIAGSLLKACIDKKPNGIYVIFLNCLNTPDSNEFAAYAGIDTKELLVNYDTSVTISETNDNASYISAQKWFAVMAAADDDVMIGDYALMERYEEASFFADLRTIYSEEELAAFGDRVVWGDICDSDGNPTGEKAPFFFEVTDSEVLNTNFCFVQEKVYLGIAPNAPRVDAAKLFVKYIMGEN
ncbi:MAG: hypothetical protein MJ107_06340 [Lachnospiraceae bacterium]|nr:hypothetical protein [Lachnospiraceae bacterium]